MPKFKHIMNVHSDEDNIKEWIDSIPKGSIFYDLGANLGWFSLYAAELGLETYAIEADKNNYVGLLENINENPNIKNIQTFNCAIANEDRKFNFRTKNDKIGSHNKTLDIEEFSASEEIVVNDIVYEVDGYTLGSIIKNNNLPNPTHIKVDIDGSEYLFLKGIKNELKNCEEIMIELYTESEYFKKSVSILESLGFYLDKTYHIPKEKNTFNFLYFKKCG